MVVVELIARLPLLRRIEPPSALMLFEGSVAIASATTTGAVTFFLQYMRI